LRIIVITWQLFYLENGLACHNSCCNVIVRFPPWMAQAWGWTSCCCRTSPGHDEEGNRWIVCLQSLTRCWVQHWQSPDSNSNGMNWTSFTIDMTFSYFQCLPCKSNNLTLLLKWHFGKSRCSFIFFLKCHCVNLENSNLIVCILQMFFEGYAI